MEPTPNADQPKLFIRVVPPIDQSMTLYQMVSKWKPKSWESVFDEAVDDLEELSTILEEQEKTYGIWFPLKKDLFRAFELTPLNEVKVCLVGQDVYPSIGADGEARATGCSFSVRRTDEIPGSLRNIFTEIKNEYPDWKYPFHGCLDNWARQGILLLNKCLTIKPNEPMSHGEIWDGFLTHVFKAIERTKPNCIYVLWGKEAQKVKKYLNNKAVILEAAHPSNRSANRGFYGCGHFKKINELLVSFGETPINWNL